MTKIKLKYAVAEILETVYEVNLRVSHQEETADTKHPVPRYSSGEPSEAQKEQRQRFNLAVAYANAALDDPELSVRYKEMARQLGKRPWRVAMDDYLRNDLLAKK